MKWLNSSKIRLMIVGFVTAVVLGGGIANADFTFGEPTNLGPTVNHSSDDRNPSISADELTLFFNSNRPGGYGSQDLWVTTRETTEDVWGTPVNLGPTINSSAGEGEPSISYDGLALYFSDWPESRPGGYGNQDLWVTTRATKDDDWDTPVNLGPTVNSSAYDIVPCISADGLALYFWSGRPGGYGNGDLWVTMRATSSDGWVDPVNLGPTVNSSPFDHCPSISVDGLTLFFTSRNRHGGYGFDDLWLTSRATKDDLWGPAMNLGPTINSSSGEDGASVSADGSTLYFDSNRAGGLGANDLWQVTIIRIVDLNGDGIVDSADMCIMVDHWGTDEALCDIGPMPWGDGIIDVQDLTVLAEYLFTYPGAVVHWKLDETEGTTVYDSINNIKAQLYGDPIWLPIDGMVDGALLLDGIDDFVGTWEIPGLSDGDFNVFAWIKGGAPGQVVVSEYQGVNWLMADATEGNLMTELKGQGRAGTTLASQTVITDGGWHRVGITWDGTNRVLYVDDVAAASDTQTSLGLSAMGLNIGCGPNETSGIFFSGLIDDVLIYDQAITP